MDAAERERWRVSDHSGAVRACVCVSLDVDVAVGVGADAVAGERQMRVCAFEGGVVVGVGRFERSCALGQGWEDADAADVADGSDGSDGSDVDADGSEVDAVIVGVFAAEVVQLGRWRCGWEGRVAVGGSWTGQGELLGLERSWAVACPDDGHGDGQMGGLTCWE